MKIRYRKWKDCPQCGKRYLKMNHAHILCGSTKVTNSGCSYEKRKEYKRNLTKSQIAKEKNRLRNKRYQDKKRLLDKNKSK